MSSADVLHRTKLSEQLASHLIERIVDGSFPPNRPLPTEREHARQFSVSVGVVREAIKGMAAMGLVEVRHGVGTFVKPRELWNTAAPMMLLVRSEPSSVIDVHDVRVPLEMAAVEWAATRATTEDLEALSGSVTQMRECLDRQAEEAFVAADLAFHLALARASHNRMLLLVLQPLIEPIHTCMLRGLLSPIAAPRSLMEHEEIAQALRDRSVRQARDAMHRHLQTSRNELLGLTATRRTGPAWPPVHGDGAGSASDG
jgi:GntR family transcriptional regulator, transcriptional repressor for pyruvate dehydrogenase complex